MGWIDSIVEWVTNLMEAIGGPGIFLAVLLENLFPPIPSELVLPLAGFTAATPGAPYGVVAAILWATSGSLVGALLLYWLGRAFGAARLRWIADRMPLVDAHDVDDAIEWFDRHGSAAIFFGRLVPGVRSLISIPAGVDQMPLLKFGIYTTLGSLVWNTVLITAGFLLGDNWHAVTDWMDRFSNVVYAVIAAALVAAVVWLVRRASLRVRAARAQDVLQQAADIAAAEQAPGVQQEQGLQQESVSDDPAAGDPRDPRS